MPSRPTPAEVSQLRQPGGPDQLEAELAREKEEVLRLRDLLIARDAELGAARGRLAMIEQGSQRLADAAARIPIPGATRLLQGMIRLLQRVLR
jgi:hypothetical protein